MKLKEDNLEKVEIITGYLLKHKIHTERNGGQDIVKVQMGKLI
jgi:hypothetical protein